MPTALAECNENITCYALIGVFRCLQGKGASICWSLKTSTFLRCFGPSRFPRANWSESKKAHEELVEFPWSAILYAKNRGRELGEFWYIIFAGKFMCVI
jgi:hypothetical protein